MTLNWISLLGSPVMAVAAAPCTLDRFNQEAEPRVPRLPAITGIPKAVTQFITGVVGMSSR